MANFPTSLDNVANNVEDVDASYVNTLQAKVGINGSAVTTSHDYKLSTVTGSAKAVATTGAQTVDGVKTFGDGIKTDTIDEETAAAGVTIDGVLLKDSQVKTDTIIEKTSAAGVTADGVLLKDSQVSTDTINELSAGVGVTIDGVNLKDSKVAADPLMTTSWTAFTPTFSGSGGSAGAFAQDEVNARYCKVGKVMFWSVAVIITNKGSWSGDVRLDYPAAPSVNISGNKNHFPIYLVATSSNPATASRGMATHGGVNYMTFTTGATGTLLQWAAVANNDWVLGTGMVELD